MDNLTHSLLGLAASKAGLEKLSPATTPMCIIASNAPDADILALLGGRWAYLHHHRGITHSIAGTIALAVLIPALFWLGDRLIAHIRHRAPSVKFRGLLIASLIVSATHPLLDWTNNYGVRPFLPWISKWYYGDLVFIIDPWLWLILGGASFLLTATNRWRIASWSLLAVVITTIIVLVPMIRPGSIFPIAARIAWLVGIVGLFVAYQLRIADRWGRSIAVAGFALIVAYWGGIAVLHNQALKSAQVAASTVTSKNGETPNRIAVMPVLANPMRWQCVFETEQATYRFDLSLTGAAIVGETIRYEKPEGIAADAYRAATQDERAMIFLGFARFPVARVQGDCLSETLVQLADLRYTEPGSGRRGTFSLEVPVECSNFVRPLGPK